MFKRGALKQPSVRKGLLFTGLILLLSYFTYVHNYQSPANFFWDENYHIPSAQRYLAGTFFMEPHPPLGKLLIALGDKLLDANNLNDQMIYTDYASKVPEEFSFRGYRFFPALLSWLSAPLMFWIFMLIVKDWSNATILSFLYVFDNAIIVHGRGAMLDPPMIFLSIAMMLLFLLMLRWKDRARLFYTCALLYGISLGLILATKALGLIMILVVPALLIPLFPRIKQIAIFLAVVSISCIVVYIGVWQIHFSLASTIEPDLPSEGYYKASDEYKQILAEGRNTSLASFPVMWLDSMKYLRHYSGGVPKLDLCKTNENGSPFFFWPFGARTISYRWETKDNNTHSYLYLVPNPVGWLVGLIGIVVGAALVLTSFLHPLKSRLKNRYLLTVFLGFYASYMIAISQLGRVMYLYHYFLPLLFSFVLFGLVSVEIQTFGRWKISEYTRSMSFLVLGLLLFFSHQLYRPLTYNLPLTREQFQRREILKIWGMRCPGCERSNYIATPRSCPAENEK